MTDKRTVIVVAPILPGKAEAWRRFMQEMGGARCQEYEVSRRRLGIQVERAWISETRQETIGIIIIEADHREEALAALATSDHLFDRWFREQLLTLQGLDLTRPDAILLSDLIFIWRGDQR
ncbi:MAG: hypothetical protein L0Y56_20455 [Nitrospira sp.]|nr:hypothetical protein [Nitrospira sp.]